MLLKKINELPKHIYDKIAAGEVVDRPVSIVKELVENSIDAGADAITIEFKNGGRTQIRVSDNGSGISKDDAALAFKRYATSKISTVEDLDSIDTLGFRGEALSSIAAVSKTELITKIRDEISGIRILVEGGTIILEEEIGCVDGTSVIVNELFYNTPARLKFLKNDSTESRLIIDFVSRMALAYPKVKIRLINNGNVLFSTTGKGDVIANILTVYSPEMGKNLITIKSGDFIEKGMRLEAYMSPPNISKANRKSQIFFVNGRSVNSDVISNSVREAYREKLFDGRHPVVVLFLYIDPSKLDVNIHPNKKEVRFNDEKAVTEFVSVELEKGLFTKEALPQIPVEKADMPSKSSSNKVKNEQVDIKEILRAKRLAEIEKQYPNPIEQTKWVKPEPVPKRFDINVIEPAGTLFSTYIIGKDPENLYLIDQHASHERVFYEKFLEQYTSEEKYTQTILTPIIVDTTFAIKSDSGEMLEFLNTAGFDISEFGPRSFAVKGIPGHMTLSEAELFINDFIDNAERDTDFKDQNKIEKLIRNSCRKAVKANYNMKTEEIRSLLDDLAATANPFSCPHGRPTIVKMTKHDIEKMFKRV